VRAGNGRSRSRVRSRARRGASAHGRRGGTPCGHCGRREGARVSHLRLSSGSGMAETPSQTGRVRGRAARCRCRNAGTVRSVAVRPSGRSALPGRRILGVRCAHPGAGAILACGPSGPSGSSEPSYELTAGNAGNAEVVFSGQRVTGSSAKWQGASGKGGRSRDGWRLAAGSWKLNAAKCQMPAWFNEG